MTLHFDIGGMACAACSSRLERVLSMQEGIAKASVNLAAATATVAVAEGYSPDAVKQTVITATKQAGFTAAPVNTDADENAAFLQKQEQVKNMKMEKSTENMLQVLLVVFQPMTQNMFV